MPTDDRLLELLRRLSVRRGEFTLASGKRSDFSVDVRQTSLNALGSRLIGEAILTRLRPEVEAVGGMSLGADPIACSAAALSTLGERPVHAFLIRKQAKQYGTGRAVEGMANLPAGTRVAIVEDTTTTGGSLLRAVERAREAGLDVVQAITVVDREEGAAERIAATGLQLETISTRSELCP